jgi:hypothetical protein
MLRNRSNTRKQRGRPKSKRSKSVTKASDKNQDESLAHQKFLSCLDMSHIKLSDNGDTCVPCTDVEVPECKTSLSNILSTNENSNITVDEFISGYVEHVNNHDRFLNTLLPMTVKGTINFRCDSLNKILLDISCIQVEVISVLIKKILLYAENPIIESTISRSQHDIPKLILHSLCWLDVIHDGKKLLDEIFQMLEVVPEALQREIITTLPEIIGDEHLNTVAIKLKDLLETNTYLTACCINTLSTISLSSDMINEFLQVALNSLSSSEPEDIPSLLKFIFHHVTSANVCKILNMLREHLDVDICFFCKPSASSTPFNKSFNYGKSENFIILNSISSALNYMKVVADGWIKVIESINDENSYNLLDLFVLFVLHNVPIRRKAITSLFVSKIKSNLIGEKLLDTLFDIHISSFQMIFPSILSLCEKLLCSTSSTVMSFAKKLYVLIFSTSDTQNQQEVVLSLVANVCSGVSSDCESALSVFQSLLIHCHEKFCRFIDFVKHILDYLEKLSLDEIRKYFSILMVLMCKSSDNEMSFHAEIQSLIRKQLYHSESRYQSIGVLGVVSLIQHVVYVSEDSDMDEIISSKSNPNICSHGSTSLQHAVSILDLVLSLTSNVIILFFDEMASVVSTNTLSIAFMEVLLHKVTCMFQDSYIIEVASEFESYGELSCNALYALDPPDEQSVAIDIIHLVTSSITNPQFSLAVNALTSHFKLLVACETVFHNGLTEVDALLGCSVVLCSLENLDFKNVSKTCKKAVCSSLFHCINWFRGLVSAFAMEDDVEIKCKVFLRLKEIFAIEKKLKDYLKETPLPLPSVEFRNDLNSKSSKTSNSPMQNNLQSCDDHLTNAKLINEKFHTFLKPYELMAFTSLSYSLMSSTELSFLQTHTVNSLEFEPSELHSFITHLRTTIDHCINEDKTPPVSRDKDLDTFVNHILPGICDYLRKLHEVGNDITNDDHSVIISCLVLFYEILEKFFSMLVHNKPFIQYDAM